MSNRRDLAILAVIVVILLSPVGVVVAQTLSTHSATAGVEYHTNSDVEVTLGDDRTVPAVPFADDETFQDGNLTVSGSNAQVEINDQTYSGDPVTVQNVDVTGEVTVTRSDLSREFTVTSGDASTLQVNAINVSDDTAEFAYSSSNGLSIRLTGQDAIGIAAVDTGTGDPVDTAFVDEDGIAEFDLPAGTRNIRLEPTPSVLEVRNESDPDQLIDGDVSLRARLFADGDVVAERPVTNGTVSLEGVPLDEELIITVKESNEEFTYRRILIDSAIETSEIYLLPTTEDAAEVRFQLQDETGRFDSEDTRIFVEKPITRNNETKYRVISGDRVGADGEFPTVLVDNERYRIRVENEAGEQRVLGSYTVQGPAVSVLPIGQVRFETDVSEGAALQTNLREAADGASYDYEVHLTYVDPEGVTSEIDVSITNSTGGAIRPTTTETINGSSAYVETYPITDPSWNPEQDTARVTVDATRNGATETFEQILGDVPDVFTDVPVNPQLLELMAIVSIVAVVGLLVIISPPVAGLVGPGYAGLLAITGLVPIPLPAVVLAGLVGVLANVGMRIR
jgi:hypothetical protein